ncbi:MAG: hypothetical protein IAE97_06290 [Chthoniobacterales bacterium]|nr:hypothetical protein [Chthoniobacterales bacterium]
MSELGRLKITVRTVHKLFVESAAGLNPAGMRLARGGVFPISRFEFDDPAEAAAEAAKLQTYLDQECQPKTTRRRK